MAPAPVPSLDRRSLLAAGLVGLGAAVVQAAPAGATDTTTASAATPLTPSRARVRGNARRRVRPVRRSPSTAAAPAPLLPSGLTTDPVLHLLRRTTYGLTPALVADVRARGTQAWLDEQLDPAGIDDSVCDGYLARLPLLHATPPQVRAAISSGAWDQMQQVQRATLARACWSKRQLFEVMVEFWNNHLHVTCPSSEVWDNRGDYEDNVIRAHALGRYSDMLVASAKSPAMLRYLNGASSRRGRINENYGREVLELHSVGVDGGYGQAGVVAAALALTGRSVDSNGNFLYRPDWHYVGPLKVLGWSSANATTAAGLATGDELLRYLASHPATARRIATRLVVRFVSDTPPARLVDELAQVYLDGGTAIVPVLRALLASPEFAASVGQKRRRPLEGLTAAVRALGITPEAEGVQSMNELGWLSESFGQAPLAWGTPDGYPDVAAAWTGSGGMLERWNRHMSLVGNWWPKVWNNPGAPGLLAVPPATAGGLVDALSMRLLAQRLDDRQRGVLLTFMGVRETDPPPAAALGWQLMYIAALILDSPTWSAR